MRFQKLKLMLVTFVIGFSQGRAAEPAADLAAQQRNAAAGQPRWCGMGGYNETRDVTVTCDGFMTSGEVGGQALVSKISIDIWEGNSHREAVISLPEATTIGELSKQSDETSAQIQNAVQRYLKEKHLPPLKGAALNVQSIQLGPNELIYKNVQRRVLLDSLLPKDLPKADITADARFAKEMVCLEAWALVPDALENTTYTPGDKNHQPLVAIQAAGFPGSRYDLIVTEDGYYRHDYQPGFGFREHYFKVPGNAERKDPTYIEEAYSDVDPKAPEGVSVGTLEPVFSDKPFETTRVGLVSFNPNGIKMDKAGLAPLHKRILEASRRYRNNFDLNARYRSATNLRLVANALNSCEGIPELHPDDATKRELDYFRGHIFPAKGAKFKDEPKNEPDPSH